MDVVARQANADPLLICMKIECLCSKAEALQIGMGNVLMYAAEGRAAERSHIQGVSNKIAAILAEVSRDFSHALHGNIDEYFNCSKNTSFRVVYNSLLAQHHIIPHYVFLS
jgi:hypothetical protein